MPAIDFDSKFKLEVQDIIENALSSRYGKDVAHVIFYNFNMQTGLKKEEIAIKPQAFEDYIDEMFGEFSIALKRGILEDIAKHFELPRHGMPPTIQEAVVSAWKARRDHNEQGQSFFLR